MNSLVTTEITHMFAKKVVKTEEKPITSLTLSEIQSELTDIPRRMELLKADRDQWSNAPLSREELRAKVNSWFSNVAAQGAEDLLSRLKTSGFMKKVGGDLDPAILLNGTSQVWQSRAVDAQGIVTVFAPLIGGFLNDWVSALPDSEVGCTTAAERDSHLARIDLERQSLVARRNALRQTLDDAARCADASIDLHALTRGGSPGGLNLERIEQKVFER